MTDEQETPSLTAAGGWCAPSDTVYELTDVGSDLLVSLPPLRFVRPGTPDWDEQQARYAAASAEHEARLAALPPLPAAVGHVWIAFRDLSYEGNEVLGITTTPEGALAVCEHHAASERHASPMTWDTEHGSDDYCAGSGSGNYYYVSRQDLLP